MVPLRYIAPPPLELVGRCIYGVCVGRVNNRAQHCVKWMAGTCFCVLARVLYYKLGLGENGFSARCCVYGNVAAGACI